MIIESRRTIHTQTRFLDDSGDINKAQRHPQTGLAVHRDVTRARLAEAMLDYQWRYSAARAAATVKDTAVDRAPWSPATIAGIMNELWP